MIKRKKKICQDCPRLCSSYYYDDFKNTVSWKAYYMCECDKDRGLVLHGDCWEEEPIPDECSLRLEYVVLGQE